MDHISKDLNLPTKAPPREGFITLPTRRKGKATRLYIDNEYFSLGYALAFPASVFAVYSVLAKYANAKTQSCYPSIAIIMKEAGVCRVTCYNAIKTLEKYRLVQISHSRGRGSNKYFLLDTSIWMPLNSTITSTINVTTNMSKIKQQPYQKVSSPRTESSIQSHIKNSDKEILVEKEGGEKTLRGALQMLTQYYKESDIFNALSHLKENGHADPPASQVKQVLGQWAAEMKIEPLKKAPQFFR